MTKQELQYVKKIDRQLNKLVDVICKEFPEKMVHSNTKTANRILSAVDQIRLSTYMLRTGIENQKLIREAKRVVSGIHKARNERRNVV